MSRLFPRLRLRVSLLAAVAALAVLPACAPGIQGGAPSCDAATRLAIVAQSVHDASYVPCIRDLRPGWRSTGFEVGRGRTAFSLVSDRARAYPVRVTLTGSCDVTGATPTTPRAEGTRTYLRLTSLSPRFAGTLFDVFPGGCVQYRFDFARGSHISLTDDFEAAVGLLSRREVRLRVNHELGVDIDR